MTHDQMSCDHTYYNGVFVSAEMSGSRWTIKKTMQYQSISFFQSWVLSPKVNIPFSELQRHGKINENGKWSIIKRHVASTSRDYTANETEHLIKDTRAPGRGHHKHGEGTYLPVTPESLWKS